jgi:hypothetical protein
MKKIILAGLLALPLVGSAQSASATVDLRLNLPVVMPQLVVVTPGVQVVPEVEEEVFFTDGYYWCRREGGWYRSRVVRGGWVAMPVRAVPVRLVEIPRGKYKRWKPAKAEKRHDEQRDHDRGTDHDRDHDRDGKHHRGHGNGHGKHGD